MPRRRLARCLAGVYVRLGCASKPFRRDTGNGNPLRTWRGRARSTCHWVHTQHTQLPAHTRVAEDGILGGGAEVPWRPCVKLVHVASPFFARTVLISPVRVCYNKLRFCVASIVASILGNKDVRVVCGPPNTGAAQSSGDTFHFVASSALIC